MNIKELEQKNIDREDEIFRLSQYVEGLKNAKIIDNPEELIK